MKDTWPNTLLNYWVKWLQEALETERLKAFGQALRIHQIMFGFSTEYFSVSICQLYLNLGYFDDVRHFFLINIQQIDFWEKAEQEESSGSKKIIITHINYFPVDTICFQFQLLPWWLFQDAINTLPSNLWAQVDYESKRLRERTKERDTKREKTQKRNDYPVWVSFTHGTMAVLVSLSGETTLTQTAKTSRSWAELVGQCVTFAMTD